VIVSYYNVIRECVVGKLHYARPTTQPIEIDDDVAAPLVEAGSLEPYLTGDVETERPAVDSAAKPETDDNKPRLVAWLLNNGCDLDEAELNRKTKTQLWDLINAPVSDGQAD
jgi:hypothetical protein